MLKIISNVCSVLGKIVSALYFDYKIGGVWAGNYGKVG